MLFAALAGLILVVVLLLTGYVWRRARQLAARARLFAADPIEPRSTFATVSVLAARHLVTREAGREEDAWLPGFPAGSEGELGVTDREVVLAAGPATLLSLPTARISEPVLLSRFRTHVADDSQGILRVRWERGGVGLETLFLVQGRRHLVERLRRDIHLRAGRAARLWVPPAWRDPRRKGLATNPGHPERRDAALRVPQSKDGRGFRGGPSTSVAQEPATSAQDER